MTRTHRGAKRWPVPSFFQIFWTVFSIAVGFALWKGGPPERLGAAVLLAMAVIQPMAHLVLPLRFDRFDVVGFVVDLMAFVGMTAIALYADRMWPLWTAALQLLACAAHVVRLLSIDIRLLTYGTMKGWPTFAALFVLVVGTAMHRRRLRRRGSDPSWAIWLPPPFWMRSMERSSSG